MRAFIATLARWTTIALVAWVAAFSAPALAQTFSGAMSGSWWDAGRGGEGQFITFETVGTRNVAYLAYFTYTASGSATWHVGNADYTPGATSIAIPVVSGSGARFGAGYQSSDAQFAPAGTATLEFVSCTRLRLRHSAMPGITLDLTRLVGPLAGAGCTDPAPSGPTPAFAGIMSGSWWNAARAGEGQFVTFETVGGRNVAYLAYFTYTSTGAASWLVGNADFATGATRLSIPLVTGSGARFGAGFRSADVAIAAAGVATLDFLSCSRLRMAYAGDQAFTVELSRLVGPLAGLPCTDQPATPPSAADLMLRPLLAGNGLTGNLRGGRTLPAIDDPLPQLGKLLFFSKALSAANDAACASCHHPALGGGDGLSVSIGAGAQSANVVGPGRRLASGRLLVGRNANTFFNVGLHDAAHFWDSRVESLGKLANRNGAGSGIRTPDTPLNVADPAAGPTLPAAQARFPVVGAAEMLGAGFPGITGDNAIRAHLAARLGDYGTGRGQLAPGQWLQKFRAAFASPAGAAEQLVTFDNIALAIAEYQRSATFVDSPFARYVRGDNAAIGEQAKRGALFFFRPLDSGGANCVQCHAGDFMSNEQHHAIGFPQVGPGMGDGNGRHGRLRPRAAVGRPGRAIPLPHALAAQRRADGALRARRGLRDARKGDRALLHPRCGGERLPRESPVVLAADVRRDAELRGFSRGRHAQHPGCAREDEERPGLVTGGVDAADRPGARAAVRRGRHRGVPANALRPLPPGPRLLRALDPGTRGGARRTPAGRGGRGGARALASAAGPGDEKGDQPARRAPARRAGFFSSQRLMRLASPMRVRRPQESRSTITTGVLAIIACMTRHLPDSLM